MAENLVTCARCGLADPATNICRLHGIPISDKQNSCPEGRVYIDHCDICGAEVFPQGMIIDISDGVHILCQKCNAAFNTCLTCGQRYTCDFESNPIDLPKQVQQQFQTAQGYVVTTIRNPERIRETCEKGCTCFSSENGCLRESNWCASYSIAWASKNRP